MARSKLLNLVFLCIVAVGGVAAAFFWRHHRPTLTLTTGSIVSPARPIAGFSLMDDQGRPFGPANLRGHWSVLFFGYTHCPDFCPATLAVLAAVQKNLRTQHAVLPQVIFVSVDSRRDTPAQLAKYVPYFDPGFIGLTAPDQPSIEAIAKQWGAAVFIQPASDGNDTVDHSGAIFVLDPNGNLAAVLTGPFTIEALQEDFNRIMARGASENSR